MAALYTAWFALAPALVTGWIGPDGRVETMLQNRPDAPAVPMVIGPRGRGTLGVFTLAELDEQFPADDFDGSFAVASDLRGGVVVWAVDGQWTSHAPSLAALEAAAAALEIAAADLDARTGQLDAAAAALTAALAAEATLRSESDILTANRLDAAEQTLGADPGDLTLLFENWLV